MTPQRGRFQAVGVIRPAKRRCCGCGCRNPLHATPAAVEKQRREAFRGSQDGGSDIATYRPLFEYRSGSAGGRIGPGLSANGSDIRFTPGEAPSRPPGGKKSTGRATAGCTVGHRARRARSSGGLVGARRFHPNARRPSSGRTPLRSPPRHGSVERRLRSVGHHHAWGASPTRLG